MSKTPRSIHPTLASALVAVRELSQLPQNRFAIEAKLLSTPAWIKLESGNRSPSDELIEAVGKWLVAKKHLPAAQRENAVRYLKALKHCDNRSKFVREVVQKVLIEEWPTPPALFVRQS